MASANALKQTNISSFFKPCAKTSSDACLSNENDDKNDNCLSAGSHSPVLVDNVLPSIRWENSDDCSVAQAGSFDNRSLASPDESVEPRNVIVTYQRRAKKGDKAHGVEISTNEIPSKTIQKPKEIQSTIVQCESVIPEFSTKQEHPKKIPSPKRVFGQYFLELGQSDFFLSTCNTCGLRYCRGDDEDEKIHNTFHRVHLQGILFKGWQNERIIRIFSNVDDRIILVLHGDPFQHQQKVKEVALMMEKEMGLSNGWLLHKFCKVYLFISSKKVVGCIVSEPIKYAYRVIPDGCLSNTKWQHDPLVYSSPREILEDSEEGNLIPTSVSKCLKGSCATKQKIVKSKDQAQTSKHKSKLMQFGNAKFEREVIEKTHINGDIESKRKEPGRSIICDEVSVPAVCGIRGIWVSRSERRKGIATKLLDAVRKTFCMGYFLDACQCAFSQPTSEGRAFAARYCGTDAFLIYKSSSHIA